MPSRVLTVILNTNHSKKFALLLQSTIGARDLILINAGNKFRVKALSLIYLQGGVVLSQDSDLTESVTRVWVSKGEPYVGPPANSSVSSNPGEVRIMAEKSYLDGSAVNQLRAVAALPGVKLAVGMPDLHPGNRFPIGCAIAAEGVYPALIGSDIGCGIALYHFSPPSRSSQNPNASRLASLLVGLDDPWPGSVAEWLARYGIERRSEFDEESLGTVGAGNHFAEICTIERIVDSEAAQTLDLQEGALYLLVHTGSRGLGGSILRSQTTSNANPYITNDSPALNSYLEEHDHAVKWAVANRDLVAHRIRECVFPSSPETPLPSLNDLGKIVDVTHNSVCKCELTVEGERQELWLHRKGAAPADRGIAPCPGSRGDFSWLLRPTGDGEYNALSLAHGAGRRHGRQVLHTFPKLPKSDLTTTSLGSEVICDNPDLLLEERPEAYKDVQCVVDDMEEQGACSGVAILRPVVTYKVRERRTAQR
ncbi:hypothetical protein JAAARDRAFT_191106 [Jaapia argillacea MUCL 33604]|uniref:3'-phosphate/5'-hydroxy nucleic acid ligase n=1 Tax=Jaapia argillacea MUCL 33604 TaxID=933084 RepID=A0A067QBW9_9AGAM|nr:hypothetical protein JAAARDRAFT_191106 [Jaapia argillacea MUCL 33604]